jgi:hypothetical protein
MVEDFLYYVWQYKTYKYPLTTVDGLELKIIKPGFRNDDSGPDFSEAIIQIGDTQWAGSVEMHLKSSDWIKHGHNNSAYDSVILHVVYEHDMDIVTSGGNKLDVLELKDKIIQGQYAKYKHLISSPRWISCSMQIGQINDFAVYAWLDRLLVERLENKTEYIESLLAEYSNNWEQVFYISLARNFGFNTNSIAFEQLAKNTPIDVLARYKDNIFQLEALLYGQADLLNPRLKDEYVQSLLSEYDFLKKKHKLNSLYSYQWKFMRMRPVNFPTIRIAQFAQLIHKSSHLLSVFLETQKLVELQKFFDLGVSEYWKNHYVLGKKTKKVEKTFGKTSFDLLLINTLVPFLFVYANHHGNEELKNRALMFLQHTKAENNSIVKGFANEGVKAHHAGHSQAMIQLKNNYCSNIKCLKCAIGLQIIKS